jgi:AcrR family transcriptional regulator
MNREEVARHQRARLYAGMIESISQRGYAKTTVAHVIGVAGVSRRAFYEQFSNKEQCFLATHDIVVARSRKLVLEGWESERGWANRLHASCKTFLDDIVAEPKGAHLVLVDSLGIGPKARERLFLVGKAYERLVANAFKLSPDTPVPAVASRAIVGGVRHVVFNRIREGRVSELRHLTEELLDWVDAYRSPATQRLSAIALRKPPDIPLAPAAFLAGDDKRARVLGSVVHLTLDEGYAELTDPHIAQFAGLSTEAFHKQFPNKEECFLAAIDDFAREAVHVVEARIGGIPTWQQAVPVAMRTFIEHLVSHPALLRMAFIDVFEVGPGMVDRMTRSVDRFTGLLAAGAPEPRRAPEIASEAITGAVWDVLNTYSSAERMRYLPCLADHLAFVVLAPYVGPKGAVDVIEASRFGSKGLPAGRIAAAKLAAPPQPAAKSGTKKPVASAGTKSSSVRSAAKKPAARSGAARSKAKKPSSQSAAKAAAKKLAAPPIAQPDAEPTGKAAEPPAVRPIEKKAAPKKTSRPRPK